MFERSSFLGRHWDANALKSPIILRLREPQCQWKGVSQSKSTKPMRFEDLFGVSLQKTVPCCSTFRPLNEEKSRTKWWSGNQICPLFSAPLCFHGCTWCTMVYRPQLAFLPNTAGVFWNGPKVCVTTGKKFEWSQFPFDKEAGRNTWFELFFWKHKELERRLPSKWV